MEFTIQPDQFDQLARVAKTAPQRPPAPLLTGVKLETVDGVLHASTFDYIHHNHGRIIADITKPGITIVSGRLLAEIIKALPRKTAHFKTQNGKLDVHCGATKFRLNTMPADDYPAPPTVGEPKGCVNADSLFDALNRAVTAASKDDTLPVLAALKFELTNQSASVLSTDRYRLTVAQTSWDGEPGDILVPARTIHEVTHSLTGPITIGWNTSTVTFSTPERTITVSLTDGDFPNIRRLIPTEFTTQAVVNVKELSDVVKRVAIVADRGTPVTLTFHDDQVTVEAGTGDDAAASETLSLVSRLVGDPVKTAFNPQFLLDGLSSQPTPTVRVGFTHPAKPVAFTPDDSHSGLFTYLLVPIRIP